MEFWNLPEMVLTALLTLVVTDLIVSVSLIIPPDPGIDRKLMVTSTISMFLVIPFALLVRLESEYARIEGMRLLLYVGFTLTAMMLQRMFMIFRFRNQIWSEYRCIPNGKGYLPPRKRTASTERNQT